MPSFSEPIVTTYAQVLVQVENTELASRTFTYQISESLQTSASIGKVVSVPFGTRQLVGLIVGFSNQYTGTAKPITEVFSDPPLFDTHYFEWLQWMADYYACPLDQVLNCALPANLIQKSNKVIRLSNTPPDALKRLSLSPLAQALLTVLEENPKGYRESQLLAMPQFSAKTVSRMAISKTLDQLKKSQWVEVVQTLQQSTGEKTERVIRLNPEFHDRQHLTAKQQRVFSHVEAAFELTEKTLLEIAKTTRETIKKLVALNAILLEERPVFRDPLRYFSNISQAKNRTLYPAQQAIVDKLLTQPRTGEADVIYGVTGSGKTEVYLSLTQKILEAGESVIVMVPEIALTSQLSRRFIECFGKNNIALWHSKLSAGEKADTWRRLANGELRIVIGARSAIWSPMQQLGLIIMDEAHDNSFKQDSPAPRYHAKTVAQERARREGAALVLGSATPDISDYHLALQQGRLFRLAERYANRPMADVRVVDMKKERLEGVKGQLSRTLSESLKANLDNQEQSIILINRRGFYTTLQCAHCDFVLTCPHCDVSLTYHKPINQVRCHYCDLSEPVPQFCPQCASMSIRQSGVGIQRVEEEIQQAFPEARILRLDTDAIKSHKNSHHEIYQRFSEGEADILLGTQMVAKGLDVANVTLVGVIAADSSFSLPDFKAAERGFQLLTQVAGRAGRGDKAGRVIFQSSYIDYDGNLPPVLQYASQQDYQGFYDFELSTRREMKYPPFSQLFRLIISSENEKAGLQFIQAAHAHLRAHLLEAGLYEQVLLIGPASCVIPRIQGRYRYHLMVKNLAGHAGHQTISDFYRNTPAPASIHFLLDTDAVSFL